MDTAMLHGSRKGSKDFSEAKRFCFEQPEAAKVLLDKITDTTIAYMKAQIKAGAQAFQLFDSGQVY